MTQAEALKILKTGANVFLTGEPGSGKTHTINSYVHYLRSHNIDSAVTASTGIAATHLGGMTIHSWSGIGIKESISSHDLDLISQKERVVKRILNTQVLIIDEISMLSSDTLNSVELVCRTLRRNMEPFGGIQVVLIGDFFQLPPVQKRYVDNESQLDFEDGESTSKFAFNSNAWKKLKPLICYLSEQYRQEDKVYLDVLTKIRKGQIDQTVRECLNGRCALELPESQITKIFSHNADVDRINAQELGKLSGGAKIFEMSGFGPPFILEGLKKNCLSPEKLELKVGAKVMFTKNDIMGKYVNGTTGNVVSFSNTGWPIVKIKNSRNIEAVPVEWSVADRNKILAQISQVPLRLAWAITVHKSQGMSLDSGIIDLRTAFEYGQGYVALSRLRALSGLFLVGYNERALEVHPEVLLVDTDFRDMAYDTKDAFSKIDDAEVNLMHKNFIKSSGGSEIASPVVHKKKEKEDTTQITSQLLKEKLSILELAKLRGLTVGTIINHIEKLLERGQLDIDMDLKYLKPKDGDFEEITKIFWKIQKRDKEIRLTTAFNELGGRFSFEELKIARLFMK